VVAAYFRALSDNFLRIGVENLGVFGVRLLLELGISKIQVISDRIWPICSILSNLVSISRYHMIVLRKYFKLMAYIFSSNPNFKIPVNSYMHQIGSRGRKCSVKKYGINRNKNSALKINYVGQEYN
jgi:hypothetical protein